MSANRNRIGVGVVMAVVMVAPCARAADNWIEAKSPNFTVVSNASEKKARNLAWQFEQIRSAMEKGLPWARVRLNRPVTIIAVKDLDSMKQMAPGFWEKGDIHPASVLSSAPDRHYVLLRSDVEAEDREGINPHNQAYRSYSSLIIDSSFSRPLPLWFSRGLSAVLSNSIVRDNEIQFGRPIPWFVRTLQQQPRLRLEELLGVDGRSEYYTSAATRGSFDAQCWLLVQYMFFGDTSDGNWNRINTFSRMLASGKAASIAMTEAYGSVEKLERASLTYLKQGRMLDARMQVDGGVPQEKYPVRKLSVTESDTARAGFHVSSGRLVEARALLKAAEDADPQQPGPYEIEGLALDRENRRAEAQQAYAKAADLNSSDFYVYARLASVAPPATNATLATAQKQLAKAIALNDGYAPAFSSLANVLLQLNQPEGALGVAQHAVELEPGQFPYHLLTARVLLRMGRRDEARKAAEDAREFARNENESRALQTFLDSLDRPVPAGRGARGAGVIGSVVGGLAQAPPPPPPPPAPGTAPLRIAGNIKPPPKTKDVRPVYPAIAQQANVQGVVIIEATISPTGTVTDAKILRSIPLLDAAALDAVRQWEFAPTLLNGVAVPVIMTVTVNFSLQ